MKPFIYYSSEVVKGFITDSLNRSMDDLAIQLEAYVMSGLKGMCSPVTAVSWPDHVSSRRCRKRENENAGAQEEDDDSDSRKTA
jgi:hypothetical protein